MRLRINPCLSRDKRFWISLIILTLLIPVFVGLVIRTAGDFDVKSAFEPWTFCILGAGSSALSVVFILMSCGVDSADQAKKILQAHRQLHGTYCWIGLVLQAMLIMSNTKNVVVLVVILMVLSACVALKIANVYLEQIIEASNK